MRSRAVAAVEQQDGQVADAKVDEAAGVVRHEGPEVGAHDALPAGPVRPVELLPASEKQLRQADPTILKTCSAFTARANQKSATDLLDEPGDLGGVDGLEVVQRLPGQLQRLLLHRLQHVRVPDHRPALQHPRSPPPLPYATN